MKRRADSTHSGLTLREAYEQHYHSSELSPRSRDHMRSSVNAWERFSTNPCCSQITNATLEQFRTAALEVLSPRTVNGYWTSIRSILRRIGPPTEGNPWALDLFPGWRVPAMRLCRVPFKRPRRLSMEDIDKIYLAARKMQHPSQRISNAPAFWQALLVFTYFTALRSSDIFKAKWSDLNLEDQTIFVKLHKTGVEADLPLHPCVLEHLKRMGKSIDSDLLFPVSKEYVYGPKHLIQLQKLSGIGFGLHDLRRTACSEIDSVAPGMGKVLLLHAPTNVTERSYLNSIPELRPAIEKMASPLSFRHGVKQAERAMKEAVKTMLKHADFALPVIPPAEAFAFGLTGATIGRHFVELPPNALLVFQSIVAMGCQPLRQALLDDLQDPSGCSPMNPDRTLRHRLDEIRVALRKSLNLPVGFNPIVGRRANQDGRFPGHVEKYVLILPSELWQRGEAA